MNKHTTPLRKLYILSFLYIGIALLNGCKSIDLPKGTSKGYSSYSIYKHAPDRMPDFSSREDFTHELIKDTLRGKFSEKGLKESESIDDAELVIAYLLIVQGNATSRKNIVKLIGSNENCSSSQSNVAINELCLYSAKFVDTDANGDIYVVEDSYTAAKIWKINQQERATNLLGLEQP